MRGIYRLRESSPARFSISLGIVDLILQILLLPCSPIILWRSYLSKQWDSSVVCFPSSEHVSRGPASRPTYWDRLLPSMWTQPPACVSAGSRRNCFSEFFEERQCPLTSSWMRGSCCTFAGSLPSCVSCDLNLCGSCPDWTGAPLCQSHF